jgi:hypothetical protein
MTNEFKTVRELLADESRWCQRELALTAAGCESSPEGPDATRFCLIGACMRIYGTSGLIYKIARRKLQIAVGCDVSLAEFNDRHTHAQVLALVIEAGV